MVSGWLRELTKPISNLLGPPAERLGKWLGSRKPRLHVHPQPTQSVWCLAGDQADQMMQIMFIADLNHDDDNQTLIIMDAYPVGTNPRLRLPKIVVPPKAIAPQQHVAAFVVPIKGKPGHVLKTKFVLVDQFHRKYKTEKITFRWVGQPPQPPNTPSP